MDYPPQYTSCFHCKITIRSTMWASLSEMANDNNQHLVRQSPSWLLSTSPSSPFPSSSLTQSSYTQQGPPYPPTSPTPASHSLAQALGMPSPRNPAPSISKWPRPPTSTSGPFTPAMTLFPPSQPGPSQHQAPKSGLLMSISSLMATDGSCTSPLWEWTTR